MSGAKLSTSIESPPRDEAAALQKKLVLCIAGFMRSIHADDPIIGPLVQGFVERLPRRLSALQIAIESNNISEVGILAHQLKGAAGGYGFPKITEVCASLESSAKRGEDTGRLMTVFAQLRALAEQAQASFK